MIQISVRLGAILIPKYLNPIPAILIERALSWLSEDARPSGEAARRVDRRRRPECRACVFTITDSAVSYFFSLPGADALDPRASWLRRSSARARSTNQKKNKRRLAVYRIREFHDCAFGEGARAYFLECTFQVT